MMVLVLKYSPPLAKKIDITSYIFDDDDGISGVGDDIIQHADDSDECVCS